MNFNYKLFEDRDLIFFFFHLHIPRLYILCDTVAGPLTLLVVDRRNGELQTAKDRKRQSHAPPLPAPTPDLSSGMCRNTDNFPFCL